MNVVVTDPGITRFSSVLASRTPDVTFEYCDPGDQDRLQALLPDAEVLVASRCTAEMLATATKLRFIQVPGAGTEKIAPEVWASGIAIANVYEHERSIAEFVFMAMLALSRDLRAMDADLRTGIWRNPMIDQTMPLRPVLMGQTVGLVGFGHIGREVADLAAAFGMKVAAVRQRPQPAGMEGLEFVGGPDELPQLLEMSDFVVIVVPLTDQTRGMIAAEQLARMKASAVLINVARGEVVDEPALYDALRAGTIAGAALDVWHRVRPTTDEVAPPSEYAFAELPNVLMTPHVSGVTEHTFSGRARTIAENLERFLEGRELLNLVSGTP